MTGFLGKVGMAVPAPAQHEEPGSRVQGGVHGQGLGLFLSSVFSPESTAVALAVLGLGLQHDHGWEELVQ